MKRLNKFLIWGLCFLSINVIAAETVRIPQINNKKVMVWQTIIYPGKPQQLKMHRHDDDRVLIALTDGVLRVKDEKGKSYLITLKKDHTYYLTADAQGSRHTDENIGGKPIKVIVVNLKS